MNKKSVINAVCIFLSIILIGVSSGLFFNVIKSYEFFGKDVVIIPDYAKTVKFTDSALFMNRLNNDLTRLAFKTNGSIYSLDKEKLELKQDEVVKNAYNEYQQQFAKFIEDYLKEGVQKSNYENYGVDYEEDSDYFAIPSKYNVPLKSIRKFVDYDKNAPALIRDIQNILNGVKGFDLLDYKEFIPDEELSYNEFSYVQNIKIDDNNYSFSVSFSFDNDDPEGSIISEYDSFVDDYLSYYADYNYYEDGFERFEKTSFKYYVINKKTGKITTNLSKNQTLDYIKNSSYFYANIEGTVKQKGLDSFIKEYNGGSYFSNIYDCYVAIDTNNGENKDFYGLAQSFANSLNNQNPQVQLIFAIISGILALILAIFVFVHVNAKKVFIDYLFTDIHLALSILFSGISIAVICWLFIQIGANIIYFDFISYALAAVAAFVWAVICEFFCSLIRVCKADKKLFENCISFRIIRWVLIKIKLILKLFIGKIKSFCSAVKSIFAYKPNEMKKSALMKIILLLGIDAFLMILCIFSASSYNTENWTIIFSIALAVINIYAAYKLFGYFISLDKIIVSAKNRAFFEKIPDNLPISLKTLNESLQYTNEELNQAVAKAVKDERLRAELITNVSHDLKTPLTSIITYVDLLNNCDINDNKAKEYIKVLDEKGLKLKRLIDDLIEASKVSSGNITLNISDLNLSELVVQAIGESENDFSKAGLNVKMTLPDEFFIVLADGNKTFRVIENLLSNAKKYSAKDSRVYVSVYKEENNGVFEIKNISAEQLNISPDDLTERFVRGDKSRTNEGNGLGLSIAKELCIAMNGKLEIIIDGDLFKAKVFLPVK